MIGQEHVVLGMKLALNVCEKCDGDLDLAIFLIKRDITSIEGESVEDSDDDD